MKGVKYPLGCLGCDNLSLNVIGVVCLRIQKATQFFGRSFLVLLLLSSSKFSWTITPVVNFEFMILSLLVCIVRDLWISLNYVTMRFFR